ncbi:hypothetical protein [Cerasicoccus maritimus]|uniref:hypothetical protein n=1 Tax=Cerasicoccus maritimus TaxID=490089 RepID=UPI0028527169|nr:hypothetical protein [Cerasicoccus maritimus]
MKAPHYRLFSALLVFLMANSLLAQDTSTNLLTHGDCEHGAAGWYKWNQSGEIKLSTDPEGIKSGKGLKIAVMGEKVNGSISMAFKYSGKATVSGYAVNNTMDIIKVALQCFDANGNQIAWIDVAHLAPNGKVLEFSRTVTIPEGSSKVNLAFILSGEGNARLDGLSVTPVN